MRAALLKTVHAPLVIEEVPIPTLSQDEILIRVEACGLCRTDLHIIDGELPDPKLPLILGHEIVGRVVKKGANVKRFAINDRVGVPWLSKSCGHCEYCKSNRENLCDFPLFTGYQKDGGFAEYCAANADFVFPLPDVPKARELAPLLCAGLIGWRALKKCDGAKKIGFFGFGVSAHILIQIALRMGSEIYAFTRPSDIERQTFAKKMGAVWSGGSDERPSTPLDAAICFAADGKCLPAALSSVKKGGIVVTAGIHMSDIPTFAYRLLWEEREVRSVANLTRADGEEFFRLIAKEPLSVETNAFPLEKINEAILAHRRGLLKGAAVIEFVEKNNTK